MRLALRSLGIRTAALVLSVFVLAAASADEPGGEPKKDKPAPLTLVNKAKDIRVVSDRDEAILDYFRRNHIIIGGVQAKELNKIFEAKEALTKFFVNYASYNDAPEKASLFGANLEIAPLSEAVAKLLDKHRPDGKKTLRIALILRQDDTRPALYHVVGCTERTSVGFFDDDKKNNTDGFSQKELCYKAKR